MKEQMRIWETKESVDFEAVGLKTKTTQTFKVLNQLKDLEK